jgi:hypothetical protein
MRTRRVLRCMIRMSVVGTKRTCRDRLTISAPEGKTDVPREPGHFRLEPERTWSALFNHLIRGGKQRRESNTADWLREKFPGLIFL